MSELRAPDPTLTEHDWSVILDHSDGEPATAHRTEWDHQTWSPACGADGPYPVAHSRDARWFAVPCRECFPDAPPLGHSGHPWHGRADAATALPDEHLSWQTHLDDGGPS